MSDIRKLLNIINETSTGSTSAGSVAPMAQSFNTEQRRVEEEKTPSPEVIEYGMWENSALTTSSKLKKSRSKAAKVVKSIYGEDVSEAANPQQQAAIAIAKKEKKDVSEGRFVKGPGGVPLDRHGNPKVPKPPKSVSTVSLRQLEKNRKEIPGQSPFKTQDEKVKKYLELKEQGVSEGSEQVYKVLAVDKSNALSDKVMLTVKAGSIEEVFERLAINDWYPLEINGVEVIKGKRLAQGVAEGTQELGESDLILNPASISKSVRGLVPPSSDRTDHEIEMAKSDLYQAGKNAVQVYELIKDCSEEEGLEGWVQEKITKAADYLNTVAEYLEGKQLESMDGVGPSTKMFTSEGEMEEGKTGPGLWANIHAKRERIKKGSGERMRKPGSKGAPTASNFKSAQAGTKK